MDTRRATSEGFVRFLDFKKAFNHQFKVGVAALLHVSRIVSGQGGTRIMQGLVSDTGEPWAQDFNWTNPSQNLLDALGNTTLLGIVQVHSAVDDFCETVAADYMRWQAFSDQVSSSQPNEDSEAERLEATCARFGWPCDGFSQWRPVLRYFRMARNCIAHRSGVATSSLQEAGAAPELSKSLAKWAKRDGADPPALPKFGFGQSIQLLPRHTILALDAAYRAADYLNRQFVMKVGVEGLSYLAAHHSLLNGQVKTIPYRSAQAVVGDALAARYHVAGVNSLETVSVLKGLGLWPECLKEFDRRHGVPKKRK
jgi:hypothetical protein